MRKRGKNLGDADIQTIVEILDGWVGAPTWEALIDEVALRLNCRYTRQALHNRERIRMAFAARKKAATAEPEQPRRRGGKELQAALDRIARLEAENARLERENNALLEQFVRWAYNAHSRGLTEDILNQPLIPVSR
ncbi:MAG: hypothetical protein HYU59_10915 [Magnetospirillum gryphiswaldense]|nr:hypothetical protein [Magnetospirillum gryphiswaldense]